MKHSYKDAALLGLFDALRLFPFSLAVGVCSGFGISGGLIAAMVSVVMGALFSGAFLPSWLTLLPVFTVAFRFGAGPAGAVIAIGGIFAFALSFVPESVRKKFFNLPIMSGFLLAAAFTTTALQTTNYFGIGAIGGTVPEIIADYLSLGFHGNWRGVLYGTITMVILITYPRKFKQFGKKVSAAFWAVLVTLLMNILLVPDVRHTPINELGAVSFTNLFDNAFFRGAFPTGTFAPVLFGALSLAVLITRDLPKNRIYGVSTASLCSGALGGVPVQTDGTKRVPLSAAVCAVVTAILYFCPVLTRLPIHSLAVILIVTAWQSVPWSDVKKSFQGGILSIAGFIVSVAVTIFLGVHYAVPILVAISLIASGKKK